MIATEIVEKISIANTQLRRGNAVAARKRSCGAETQLSFDRIRVLLIIRAEQSFAIRCPSSVIKSLCDNLDICPHYYANAYFQSRNSARVISVAKKPNT